MRKKPCKLCFGGGVLYIIPMRWLAPTKQQSECPCPRGCRRSSMAKVDWEEVTYYVWPQRRRRDWANRHLTRTGYFRGPGPLVHPAAKK